MDIYVVTFLLLFTFIFSLSLLLTLLQMSHFCYLFFTQKSCITPWGPPRLYHDIIFLVIDPIFLNPHLKIRSLIWERDRDREGQRDTLMWERNIIGCLVVHTPAGDQTHNPGMRPDWELSQQTFGVWDNAPTTWATQQGLLIQFLKNVYKSYSDLLFLLASFLLFLFF